MIERDNPNLSITQQCWTQSISRSSFYYAAKGESEARAERRCRKEEDSSIVIAHQGGISTHSFAPER